MCLLWVEIPNTKSMTEKIGGNKTGAVEALALCVSITAQAVPERWLGGKK